MGILASLAAEFGVKGLVAKVHGDNQHVMQFMASANRNATHSSALFRYPWYRKLDAELTEVRHLFQKVPRTANRAADKLARQGRSLESHISKGSK